MSAAGVDAPSASTPAGEMRETSAARVSERFSAVIRPSRNSTCPGVAPKSGESGSPAAMLGELGPKRHAAGQRAGAGRGGAELAAGAGRGRKTRVADLDDHLLQRHAHGLGGDLGEDGVAAGADVGHALLQADRAVGLGAHGGLGGQQEVAADGGRHAHADQPAAVAHLAGLRIALAPAERLGAVAACTRSAAGPSRAGRSRGACLARCGCAARSGRGRAGRPARPSPPPG